MKKIVCANCGLVNLEGFVSFPHCAACGALLKSQEPNRWRATWRRPVKPLYWMLAVGGGLAALGLAIASVARETREGADKPLLVYAQIPRTIAPGGLATVILTLDSAEENVAATFKTVRLRLSRETRDDVRVIKLRPPPQRVENLGSGRYYQWDELPRGTALQVDVQARARRDLRWRVTVSARNHRPFELRASIDVAGKIAAPTLQKAPGVAQ